MMHYQNFYATVVKMEFPPYHDPLTIFYILHPEEFVTKKALIEVDTYPTSYGRTNCTFSIRGS